MLALIGAYVLLFGTGYQWGYWSQFGVDFLQFAAINETIGQSIISSALPLLAVIFGVLIAYPITGDPNSPFYLVPGEGRNSKIGRSVSNVFVRSGVTLLLALITWIIHKYKPQVLLSVAPLIWGPFVSVIFVQSFIKLDLGNPTPHIKGVVSVLGILVLLAPSWGEYNASKAKEDHYAKYVSILFSNVVKENFLQENKKYKYLGKLGDRIFILGENNSILSIKNDFVTLLTFY